MNGDESFPGGSVTFQRLHGAPYTLSCLTQAQEHNPTQASEVTMPTPAPAGNSRDNQKCQEFGDPSSSTPTCSLDSLCLTCLTRSDQNTQGKWAGSFQSTSPVLVVMQGNRVSCWTTVLPVIYTDRRPSATWLMHMSRCPCIISEHLRFSTSVRPMHRKWSARWRFTNRAPCPRLRMYLNICFQMEPRGSICTEPGLKMCWPVQKLVLTKALLWNNVKTWAVFPSAWGSESYPSTGLPSAFLIDQVPCPFTWWWR